MPDLHSNIMTEIKRLNSNRKYQIFKRQFDIIFSIIGLIIFAIPILIFGIIIKITSRGPVIHWSERVGLNNTCFFMAKLRTMKIGSPQLSSNHFINPENYFIRFGKFFRDFGIDELPQLYNILKGDMSFVGPRPVVFDDIETITLRNEKKLVNNIKPGLTGLAQINGRSKITIPEKIKYDEIYKEKMCFMLDIIIIIKTNYYLIQENIFKNTVKNRKSEQLPYIQIGLTNVENTIF